MKPNLYNHTLLAVGIAAAMGISTLAKAAESGAVGTDAAPIKNIATAVYSVGTGDDAVKQPKVQSNEVVVNISETASFTLVAIDGATSDDDINEDINATPGGTTTFNHVLGNKGNVTDTYTITTTGNDSNIDTKAPNYSLDAATEINYTIKQIGGGALTPAQSAALAALKQTENGTIKNGETIQLPPGLEAVLNYQVKNPVKEGGQVGVGTLTATSTFIAKAEPAKQTLINENQTIISLPVFKIEKSAACQGKPECNTLDLNAANTDIDYTVKVTNVKTDYSADADNFVIRDVLPKGMTLKGDVTLTSGATVVTAGKDADGRQIIDVTVPKLEVESSIELSFKVAIDVDVLRAAGSATNNATVYDSYDNTTPNLDDTDDITDSTNDTTDSPNVPTDTDGSETDGKDTTPTITFTDRDISITDADDQEVPVTGKVTYTHTITNNGNEDEGNSTADDGVKRPVVITITDPSDSTLSIDKTDGNVPYYSRDGGTTKLPLVDNNDGTYQLPDDVILVPNTSIDPKNPAPGSTVEIGYTVISAGSNADIDVTKETNTITVKPGGDFAPTVPPLTNETSIQGLKLVKLAAVFPATGIEDLTCPTGTDINNLNFSDGTTPINAKPFDCIVYKITATNTFKTKELSAVTVSDTKAQWDKQATYQGDVEGLSDGSNSGVTDDASGTAIKSTFDALQAEKTGTMTFSIQVNP